MGSVGTCTDNGMAVSVGIFNVRIDFGACDSTQGLYEHRVRGAFRGGIQRGHSEGAFKVGIQSGLWERKTVLQLRRDLVLGETSVETDFQ